MWYCQWILILLLVINMWLAPLTAYIRSCRRGEKIHSAVTEAVAAYVRTILEIALLWGAGAFSLIGK